MLSDVVGDDLEPAILLHECSQAHVVRTRWMPCIDWMLMRGCHDQSHDQNGRAGRFSRTNAGCRTFENER